MDKSLRVYGDFCGVEYRRQGYDIYSHGTKYKLISDNGNKFVTVNTLPELKEEINKFNREHGYG
jgi:hypothetical protein